jgi:hypothetical protein
MKRFFDGTDQENSKTQGGKREIRKIKKKTKKEGKKKKRFLPYIEERVKERKRRDFARHGGKNEGKKKKRFCQTWRKE